MGFITISAERNIRHSQLSTASKVGQNFGQLLESVEKSDVQFEVEGEIFAARKLSLRHAPCFKDQLFGTFKEHNTKCIRVEAIKASVFKVQTSTLSFCFSPPNVMHSFLHPILSRTKLYGFGFSFAN